MKRLWVLTTIIMSLITVYQIGNTYAKYSTEVNSQMERNVGAWAIKVNDTDISNGVANQEFEITSIEYNSNDFVMDGKVAPGLQGFFDITIDATDASVAVVCDISIDFSLLDIGDSIRFTSIKRMVNDGEPTEEGIVRTGEDQYSTVITLDEIRQDKIITVRFYIDWLEESGDEADTEIGESGVSVTTLPVGVVVSQYFGEELVTYVEPEENT